MVPENKQNRNKNKLSLSVFKIIAILHNTLLATFIKLLETVSKSLFRNRSQNRCHTFLIAAKSAKLALFMMPSGGKTRRSPPYSPDMAPAGAISGKYGGLQVPRKLLQFSLRLGWMWIMVRSVKLAAYITLEHLLVFSQRIRKILGRTIKIFSPIFHRYFYLTDIDFSFFAASLCELLYLEDEGGRIL
jgi:hypothetical protein